MRLVVYCGLVCIWNFDQPIQFEMPCLLWLRINESVDGDSIFEPQWWGCICNSVDGDSVLEPRWWGYVCNFVDNDSIFEPRWWGCIYNFAFDSVDDDSIYKPRWWGCIYNFVLRQKHGVQLRFLKAVVNNSNKLDYRLTVRMQLEATQKSRAFKRIIHKLRKRKVHKEIKSLLKKSVQKSSRIYKMVVNYKATLASSKSSVNISVASWFTTVVSELWWFVRGVFKQKSFCVYDYKHYISWCLQMRLVVRSLV